MTRYDSTSAHDHALRPWTGRRHSLAVGVTSLLPNRRGFWYADPVVVETGVLVAAAVASHLTTTCDFPSDRTQVSALAGGEP